MLNCKFVRKLVLQIGVLQQKNVTLVLKYVSDVSIEKISTIAKIF